MTYYIMSPIITVSDHKTRAEAVAALEKLKQSENERIESLRERIRFVERFIATLTIETSKKRAPGHVHRLEAN